jgi:hypothetical protein
MMAVWRTADDLAAVARILRKQPPSNINALDVHHRSIMTQAAMAVCHATDP